MIHIKYHQQNYQKKEEEEELQNMCVLQTHYSQSSKITTVTVMLMLTFPLQKQPEEGAGSGDGFLVVVIIVDGQQVTVHISIAHQQLHIGDVMDMLQKAIELIEATWFGPIEREATKLCPKLGQIHTKKKNQDILARSCAFSFSRILPGMVNTFKTEQHAISY